MKHVNILVRKAILKDSEPIWHIIKEVIKEGDTYVFSPNSSKRVMMDYWFSKKHHVYVATIDNNVAGTCIIKENLPGLGSHVANSSYMVHPNWHCPLRCSNAS